MTVETTSCLFLSDSSCSFFAKNLDPLLHRLKLLLARRSLDGAKHQLRNQTPVARQVELFGHVGVDEGVVVLQVGAESEGLETGPDCVSKLSTGLIYLCIKIDRRTYGTTGA